MVWFLKQAGGEWWGRRAQNFGNGSWLMGKLFIIASWQVPKRTYSKWKPAFKSHLLSLLVCFSAFLMHSRECIKMHLCSFNGFTSCVSFTSAAALLLISFVPWIYWHQYDRSHPAYEARASPPERDGNFYNDFGGSRIGLLGVLILQDAEHPEIPRKFSGGWRLLALGPQCLIFRPCL